LERYVVGSIVLDIASNGRAIPPQARAGSASSIDQHAAPSNAAAALVIERVAAQPPLGLAAGVRPCSWFSAYLSILASLRS